ncbi:hypothetical protein AB0E10_37975 [Streptomyces sp. NPDC048045]|uniref:hypothetical protein n=1 Tax=Streptomyces sp. NPDC048045 TaxID=3154710 RepID=UPI0034229EBC
MISFNDQELSAAIQNADSAAWSVRAVAGRQLAMSDKIDVVADIIHRLLLDAQDTAVTQETAVALLARKDTVGLRCVLLAASYSVETWTADEIYTALNGDPDWMTTNGADRLIKQLYELATDDDAGVRHEVQEILAGLRPREQWTREPDSGTCRH